MIEELVQITQELHLTEMKAGTLLQVPKQVFVISLEYGALYIREEYLELAKMIKDNRMGSMLITGNTGIGKSVFGVFLLILPLKDKENVTYRPRKGPDTYYFTWDEQLQAYVISTKPQKQVQYIAYFDGSTTRDQWKAPHLSQKFLFAVLHRGDFFGLFSSFRSQDWKGLYMNPWTKSECQDFVNQVELDEKIEAEWYQKFNLIGGKPRFLFECSAPSYDELVQVVKQALPSTLRKLNAQVWALDSIPEKNKTHLMINIYQKFCHFLLKSRENVLKTLE